MEKKEAYGYEKRYPSSIVKNLKAMKLKITGIACFRKTPVMVRNRYPRQMVSFLKKRYKESPLVGCEVGCFEGEHLQNIMRTLNIKKMYSIDESFGRNLIKDKRIIFIEKPSSQAWKNIHEKLDFVYIDGAHEFKYVLEDITNYAHLVKNKGIVGGHDFNNTDVSKAVLTYMHNHKIPFDSFYANDNDWWFVKTANL